MSTWVWWKSTDHMKDMRDRILNLFYDHNVEAIRRSRRPRSRSSSSSSHSNSSRSSGSLSGSRSRRRRRWWTIPYGLRKLSQIHRGVRIGGPVFLLSLKSLPSSFPILQERAHLQQWHIGLRT